MALVLIRLGNVPLHLVARLIKVIVVLMVHAKSTQLPCVLLARA